MNFQSDQEEIQYLKGVVLDLAKKIANGTAGKIDAIRGHRAATGSFLKDAKDWAESLACEPAPDRLAKLEDRVQRLENQVWNG